MGPSTRARFCDTCINPTPLPISGRGISSPIQAWRAGPMSAKPTPISKLERNSIHSVITSVTTSTPVPSISTAGMICPSRTSGFFAYRSAITPPIGPSTSIENPLPISASPDAVYEPVIS